ncbi:MAG: TorD/DmsD family molecular chaperone [Pseudomonadota bacterium]
MTTEANAFRVLSAVLAREPSSEMRDRLADGLLHDLLPVAADDPEAMAALDRVAAAAAADPGDPPRRLAAAFAGLFLGGGGKRSALPFASVYRSPTGRLFQEPAVAMTDLLRRADLDLAPGAEAPDHVAVQLALLADLLERGDPASLALAAELRDAELLPWLPDFVADCARFDASGLYAAASFLALWLARRDAAHDR